MCATSPLAGGGCACFSQYVRRNSLRGPRCQDGPAIGSWSSGDNLGAQLDAEGSINHVSTGGLSVTDQAVLAYRKVFNEVTGLSLQTRCKAVSTFVSMGDWFSCLEEGYPSQVILRRLTDQCGARSDLQIRFIQDTCIALKKVYTEIFCSTLLCCTIFSIRNRMYVCRWLMVRTVESGNGTRALPTFPATAWLEGRTGPGSRSLPAWA